MIWRTLILLWFLGGNCDNLYGQYQPQDLQKLYQTCTKTRLDSVHRLITSFLRKHEVSFVRKGKIIQTPEKFYKFCDAFRAICTKNNQQALLRRLEIIVLIDKLKYENTLPAQTEKAFYKLFQALVAKQDYSAALSCLLEAGLIQGFYGGNKQHIQVVKMLFFAEKFAEKHALSKDIALQSVFRIIGYILWEFDIHELSIQYFKKSLQTGFSTRDDSLIVLNGIGINYQKLHDYEKSNEYLQKASLFALHHKNTLFNAIIEGNMAVNLYKTGKLDQAYRYALQDKNASLQNELWENAVGAMYWLVQIELKRNNFAHAKILLDSLEGTVGKVKNNLFLAQRRQKEAIYFYEKALQDPTKTLLAYQAYVKADSTFQTVANKTKISEMKLMAEVELYTQEMAQKEQEKQASTWFFAILVSALLLLIVVLAGYFYKSRKTKLREIKELKTQLFTQIQAIHAQTEDLQVVISKEATEQESDTMEFDAERVEVQEADIQYLRNFNLAYKEQWIGFKESFLKVYPMFEKNLTDKIGALSQAELRLLMLHKLSLSNQEIAKMLLISPESVRTGKYRLYKKFGISSNEELDKIL